MTLKKRIVKVFGSISPDNITTKEECDEINFIKAITRAGMGACGSKTCRELIYRLFREEGIQVDEITDRVDRPLFIEVSLGAFAKINDNINHKSESGDKSIKKSNYEKINGGGD